jgi:hypothetical protein
MIGRVVLEKALTIHALLPLKELFIKMTNQVIIGTI